MVVKAGRRPGWEVVLRGWVQGWGAGAGSVPLQG